MHEHPEQGLSTTAERISTVGMTRILEVWHGGIPHDAPALPRCRFAHDCPTGSLGEHSHIERISEKPFSIDWRNWIRYHMTTSPLLVVHIYRQASLAKMAHD